MKKLRLLSAEVFELISQDDLIHNKNDIIIKTDFCGICGADMKSYRKGHRDLIYPRVLGHEITGTVVSIPHSSQTNLRLGDHVQVYPGQFCGKCSYCQSGHENLCDNMQIMGFHVDGGLQEYIAINIDMYNNILSLIPENLTLQQASFAEPLACSINMQDKMSLSSKESLLIIGAGRLGMINYFLAKKRGLNKTVIADIYTPRLNYNIYENTLDLSENDYKDKIKKMIDNSNFDAVIICTSVPETFQTAINLSAKGGKIGYFSGFHQENISTKILNNVHYKELSVFGSYGCTLEGNRVALKLLKEGILPFKNIEMNIFNLEETEKAIDLLEQKKIFSALIGF
ncbi:MAG: alcohol dehydrogenase catalytic domain-containing protein [Eubacteriaceae bacterium]